MNALEFNKVRKFHGTLRTLDGLDLQVAQGEVFGLVGINGAGKTTLLKALLALSRFDSGTIRIFGIDNQRPAARAALSFLPERFAPPYFLKAEEFLRHTLALQRTPYDHARALQVLAALELDAGALARPVRLFSKGMVQKLGLASCFLAHKPLYVLDEPMSGLDPKARALLKGLIAQQRREGATVFMTSHSLADVEELCDGMAILHAGAIRFSGAPAQCTRQYGAANLESAFLTCIGGHDTAPAGPTPVAACT